MTVPGGFAGDRLCVLHYTLFVEQECAEMRRESALGKNSHERQNELMGKIADRGEALVHVATSGFPMSRPSPPTVATGRETENGPSGFRAGRPVIAGKASCLGGQAPLA